MIRRPPRSTLSSSSAASDVYKRQLTWTALAGLRTGDVSVAAGVLHLPGGHRLPAGPDPVSCPPCVWLRWARAPVSYTHLRAHETPEHLVCRLLLEKKKNTQHNDYK